MSSHKSLFTKSVSKKPKIDNEEKQESTTSQNTGRIVASTSPRKPAFNPAILSSAFYTGPTTYGGAGAVSSSSPYNQFAKSKFYDRKKTDIKVTPSKPQCTMSKTSRRILDILDQYSSPISDAKRVPINSKPLTSAHRNALNSFSIFDMSKRSTQNDVLTPSSSKSHRFRELQIPSKATQMKMKKNNRASGNAHAAIMASMSSSAPYKPDAYSLRSNTESSSYKNKMKSKLSNRGGAVNEEEMAQPVNLPNITLNMTGLPTFTMEPFKPTVNSTKYTTSDRRDNVPFTSASVQTNFKFSSPVAIGNTENLKPTMKFKFSEPFDIFNSNYIESQDQNDSSQKDEQVKKPSEVKNTFSSSIAKFESEKNNKTDLFSTTQNDKSESTPKLSHKRPAEMWNGNDNWKKSETEKYPILNGDVKGADVFGKKSQEYSPPGNNMGYIPADNIMVKKVKTDSVTSSTGSLESFIKKQQDQWECSSCMTRNEQNKTKCVCCETPKPGAQKTPQPLTKSSEKTHLPSLDSFVKKQQECSSCMTRNDQSKINCVCCETIKPGTQNITNILKKQQEQWECSCCLTRNDQNRTKCVCCEASKPGCEPTSTAGIQFNFGKTKNTFKFGIDKANEPIKPSVTDSNPQNIKNPETQSNPSSFFAFGNPTAAADNKSGNGSIGGFKFGVTNGSLSKSADQTVPKMTDKKDDNATGVVTGGFSFGIKKSEEVKTSTVPTPVFENKSGGFSFSSPQTVTDVKKESEKHKLSFGSTPSESKSPSIYFMIKSDNTPISTITSTTRTTDSTKGIPPKFSFGAPQPAAKINTPFKFGSSVATAPSTTSESTFKSSILFSFGSKSTTSNPLEVKPSEAVSKPAFQLPNTISGSLFPSAGTNQRHTEQGENTTQAVIGSAIQFTANPLVDKPKDQPAPATSFFAYTAPVSTSVSTTATSYFKSPISSVSTFTFGTSVGTTAVKSEGSALFKAPATNPTLNLFGTKPDATLNNPSNNLFKAAPTTTPSTFTSPLSSNIFGSAQSTTSQLPSSSVFGSGSLTATATKPPVTMFGTAPLSSDTTPQTTQIGSLFTSPAVPSFNIFANTASSTTVPTQSTKLFGITINKPATETRGGMFNPQPSSATGRIIGSDIPAAAPAQASGSMFGSSPSVTTPVFGASIPFGEAASSQVQQSTPFKFGASTSIQPPVMEFDQAPAAGSSAPVFYFGTGAPAPPPSNSQFNFSMGAPSSAFPSTPPLSSNIFGSAQSTTSQLPSSSVFGSGSLSTTATKPPVAMFGTAPLSSDTTPQTTQIGSLFTSPAVPSFNIFANTASSTTVPTQPTKLFGSTINKPATETGGGMFNPQPSSATGRIFGSNISAAAPAQASGGMFGSSPSVPIPVFGASIPFAEAASSQVQQSTPFKFGASTSIQPTMMEFDQAPAAGSSAPVFSFGMGAPAPPPSNSQFNFSMGDPSSAFPSTPGAMANPAQRRIKKAVRRSVLL